MQTMSNKFNEIVENGNALYYITITDSDGNNLDLQIDNFEYVGAKCSDSNISFGNTPCQSIKFSIHNPTVLLENKEIEIKQGLYTTDDTLESLRIGYFTIQKPTSDGEVVQYIGYDRMFKFEKAYFTSLTSYKVSAILNELSNQTGVKINIPSATDYTLSKKPEGYTSREMLGYIAGLYGYDAFVNRDGEIIFKWYNEVDYTIDGNRIYQGATNIGSEYNFVLQKIECTVTDGDDSKTLTVGSGAQGIYIENPFMTQTILENIYTQIRNFSFRTLSTEFLGDFRIDLGDIITVIKDKISYKVPLMEITHKSDGGVRTTIAANAETESEQEFDVKGPNTKFMERYYAELVLINKAMINKLDVEDAKITYATIENLKATDAVVEGKLNANELEAAVAELGYLKTDKANITYATITDLNATKANITEISAAITKTNTLIFGSAAGDTIQTLFSNSVIAQLGDAQIKSAMIDSINANKITGLDINTTNLNIHSDDGKSTWRDNTIQISDGTRVRIQLGKDAQNDYNMYIWDKSGNLMFDALGLTEDGINRQIIDNDAVKENAGIKGSKLDIDSVVSSINSSSSTLKSSKIYLDDESQTLDVSFKALTTDIDELTNTVNSQGTQLSTIQGQITTKIWQEDIITAVSNLEIGGRNYFVNSTYKNGTESWYPVNGSELSITTIDNRTVLTAIKGTSNYLFCQTLSNFKYNKNESVNITISAEIYAEEPGNVMVDTYVRSSDGWKSIKKSATYIVNELKQSEWIKFSANIELYSESYEGDVIVAFRTTATTMYMYHAKLETGSKATDYSVAIEDTESEVDVLSTKYTTLTQDVRRHIVGGSNRTLISAKIPPRSCRIGNCRRISAEWPQIVIALFEKQHGLLLK